MGKITKYSSSHRHGGEAKEWWRANRSQDLIDLCAEFGLDFKQLTQYQLRVGGKVDFYTTNGRYHILSQNKRGDYHTFADARRLLEQIQQGKV